MTSTGGTGNSSTGASGDFTVTCRCGWTAGPFDTRNQARTAGDEHLAEANAEPEE